jgi:hypothetical protein
LEARRTVHYTVYAALLAAVVEKRKIKDSWNMLVSKQQLLSRYVLHHSIDKKKMKSFLLHCDFLPSSCGSCRRSKAFAFIAVQRKYASLENPKTKTTQCDDPSVYKGYDNEIFIRVGKICYDT